jgi:hypothetical protein
MAEALALAVHVAFWTPVLVYAVRWNRTAIHALAPVRAILDETPTRPDDLEGLM